MFMAKCRESAYVDSEYVTEAFCSLLRRDIKDVYKSKGNTLVSVLAANLLLSAYRNEKTWPDIFVRVSSCIFFACHNHNMFPKSYN